MFLKANAGNLMLLWYTCIVWENYSHFWELDVGAHLAIGSSECILVLKLYMGIYSDGHCYKVMLWSL